MIKSFESHSHKMRRRKLPYLPYAKISTKIFVVFFSPIDGIYDETFRHFSWSKNLLQHQKKPWMAYLIKIMETFLETTKIKTFTETILETSYCVHKYTKFITIGLEGNSTYFDSYKPYLNFFEENINLPVGTLNLDIRFYSFKQKKKQCILYEKEYLIGAFSCEPRLYQSIALQYK